MKEKIVSCVVVASFLLYAGCYDSVELTKQQLLQSNGQSNISVVTKLCRKYEFKKGRYCIQGDSLYGVGVQKFTPPFNDQTFRDPIALSDILLIETSEFSAGKTILLAGGIALAVAGVIALNNGGSESAPPPPPPPTGGKFSCPFIYTYDGAAYHFESETFSGSVFKGLERSAFDVLNHIAPVDGVYKLKLVNARDETEYVNELKLIAIDHPIGTSIIPDRNGNVHTISRSIPPARCTADDGRNALREISARDNVYWSSSMTAGDLGKNSNLRDGLTFEFPRPPGTTSVKLVVSGKNTRLGYFALAKIFQLKGDDKMEWYSKLETDPAERAKFVGWIMREGMLHAKVWHHGRWVERTAFIDVGPGISKEQVAVINIDDITGSVLKIRLDCTTDLWCIDQVYVDYSPDFPVLSTELSPAGATSEHGQNIAGMLKAADDRYYVTISNQYADIEFPAVPEREDCNRSYVAKTRGFYYQWVDAEGSSQDMLVDQILSGDPVGARYVLSQWSRQRSRYEGISGVR